MARLGPYGKGKVWELRVGFIKGEAAFLSDDSFCSPPRGLQLRTAHSPEPHGGTSSSISSIQLHGPEAGSVLQNAGSRSLAGAQDGGGRQRVGSFKSDLEAMGTCSRLTANWGSAFSCSSSSLTSVGLFVCGNVHAWLLPLICLLLRGRSSVSFSIVCRQKDKERKSRLSLFLTKSGSHENVSPHKKENAPANK